MLIGGKGGFEVGAIGSLTEKGISFAFIFHGLLLALEVAVQLVLTGYYL